mmetsp:Transcript_10958/g.20413  ORF Transcript_10958/g.20413 Transcript_10958/m.20413 type:complete len:169 (+) Transcript_10958:219-725(+)
MSVQPTMLLSVEYIMLCMPSSRRGLWASMPTLQLHKSYPATTQKCQGQRPKHKRGQWQWPPSPGGYSQSSQSCSRQSGSSWIPVHRGGFNADRKSRCSHNSNTIRGNKALLVFNGVRKFLDTLLVEEALNLRSIFSPLVKGDILFLLLLTFSIIFLTIEPREERIFII